MSNTPNSRLKAFIDSLSDTYEELANKTGLARRTWQRQVEEGASIKSDYLLKLREIYGADVNWILTGEKSVPTVEHPDSESVSSMKHFSDYESIVREPTEDEQKREQFDEMRKNAPFFSKARRLKASDYDNPMIILNAAIADIKRDWESWEFKRMSELEQKEWLLDALQIITRISTKYVSSLEKEIEELKNKLEE